MGFTWRSLRRMAQTIRDYKMKIYMIPYTFKAQLSTEKFHSGIDVSMLQTARMLKTLGHDIRIFAVSGNLPEEFNAHFYNKNPIEDLKAYAIKNRNNIYDSLILDIKNFKPDVIFSSHGLNKIYNKMHNILEIPIIYQTHAIPGFFTDLNNGNMLHELSGRRLTIVGVSEYHKVKFEKYYSRKIDCWDFGTIEMEGILPSSFCPERYTAVESDGIVRHVSALNPEKKTFAIHDYLEGTGIDSEVFTTSAYIYNSNDKIVKYGKNNLEKYGHKTRLDAYRSDVIDAISKASCSFVGLASYDTYTITSLESMMYGTPLIVFGNTKRDHPALEMCDDIMKEKFISVIRTKEEFLNAVKKYQTYTLADRQELADRTYEKNSPSNFGNKLELLLKNAINKGKNSSYKLSSLESFFSE